MTNSATGETALDALIDRIYETSGLPEGGGQALLRTVAEACHASAAVLLINDRVSGALSFSDEMGLDSGYRPIYLQSLRYEDLRLQDLLRHPLGTVRTDAMIERYQDYLASRAYRELYSRLGTEHALGAFLVEEGRQRLGLRLFRSSRDGPFAEAEIGLYRHLVPHLRRALRLRRQGEALRRRAQASAAVLALLPWALFRATDGEALEAMNRAGEALLGRIFGLPEVLRPLLECPQPSMQRLDLESLEGHETWQCRIQPLSREDARAACVLLLAPLQQATVQPPDMADGLVQLFALTAAEARLVTRLSLGDSLDQAAAALGIARETARSHLRAAFAKTRTGRQAELVRLASGSVAALGSRSP
ncbi:MAG: helix-turn-helix transcriptional regulator [Rhodospirillales bacterium]